MGTDDKNSIPPSFRPAGRRSRDTAGSSAAQPSSAPSSAGSAGSSSGDVPPSFAPNAARNTQRRSTTHHAQSAHRTSTPAASAPPDDMPASFAPSNRSQEPRKKQPTSRQSAQSSQRSQSHQSDQRSSVPVAPSARRAPRPRGKRSIGKVIGSAFMVIVLLFVVMFAAVYVWVNSSLNRQAWLTDMKNNSNATTWLILGSDERDGSTVQDGTTGARTDTILVLTKPKKGAASLISIPRDSLVEVNGYYMKLNAVMGDVGRTALTTEIEDITGYKVDHVAEISFGGLQGIVDAIGGVNLCYDSDVNDEKSGMVWTAGCHTVGGAEALAFSRMRYSDPRSDFGRAERQRQVIGAIAKKAVSPSVLLNPFKIHTVGQAVLDSLTVDKKTSPITLVQMLLAFHSASGSNGITGTVYWTDPDYYVDGVGSSVVLDNEKNHELFTELSDGSHAAGRVGSL